MLSDHSTTPTDPIGDSIASWNPFLQAVFSVTTIWAGAPRQRPPELKWSGILLIIVGTVILTLMIALTTRSLL